MGVIELLAESMTLADKTGVGADLLYEFIKEFLREFTLSSATTCILDSTDLASFDLQLPRLLSDVSPPY